MTSPGPDRKSLEIVDGPMLHADWADDESLALEQSLAGVLDVTGPVPALVALVSPVGSVKVCTTGVAVTEEVALSHVAAQALTRGETTFVCAGRSFIAVGAPAGEDEFALVAAAVERTDREDFVRRARSVAVVLARSVLLSRDRRRIAQFSRLAGITQHVLASLDLNEVLTEIVRSAVELLGAETGDILLLDEERDVLRVAAVAGFDKGMLGFEMDRHEGISARAMLTRRAQQVTDYQHYRHRVKRLDAYQFRAVLCAPLIVRDQPIGALNIHVTGRGREFGNEDAGLLTSFANHAAIAIDNARHYQDEVELRRALAEANHALSRSRSIQQRLSELVLSDCGPDGLVTELAGLLGRPIVVQDHFLRIITGAAPDGGDGWRALAIDSPPLGDPSLAGLLRPGDYPSRAGAAPQSPVEDRSRVVVPIRLAADQLVAILVLASKDDLGPLDQALVDIAATGVALELAKARARVEVEHRLRGDVVQDLLSGSYSSPETMSARAAHLGYDLATPRTLMLFQLDAATDEPPAGEDQAASIRGQHRFFEIIRDEVMVDAPASMFATRGDIVIALVAPGQDRREERARDSRATAERLHRRLAARLPSASMCIVLGDTCSAPDEYGASYRRALRTLEAARILGRNDSLVATGELGVVGLLALASSPDVVRTFATTFLAPISNDADHGGELLATLRSYVECGFNQREVARRCYLHVNTVSYRVGRIESLLGVDLRHPDDLLDVMVALRVTSLADVP